MTNKQTFSILQTIKEHANAKSIQVVSKSRGRLSLSVLACSSLRSDIHRFGWRWQQMYIPVISSCDLLNVNRVTASGFYLFVMATLTTSRSSLRSSLNSFTPAPLKVVRATVTRHQPDHLLPTIGHPYAIPSRLTKQSSHCSDPNAVSAMLYLFFNFTFRPRQYNSVARVFVPIGVDAK